MLSPPLFLLKYPFSYEVKLTKQRYKGPAFSDRTHYFVTYPVFKDFLLVSHFGVCEDYMPVPCTKPSR